MRPCRRPSDSGVGLVRSLLILLLVNPRRRSTGKSYFAARERLWVTRAATWARDRRYSWVRMWSRVAFDRAFGDPPLPGDFDVGLAACDEGPLVARVR